LKKLYENLFLKNGINATPHEDEWNYCHFY
jgi:hypothetical protein